MDNATSRVTFVTENQKLKDSYLKIVGVMKISKELNPGTRWYRSNGMDEHVEHSKL